MPRREREKRSVLHRKPDVVAVPTEPDPGGFVRLPPDQLWAPGRLDEGYRRPEASELRVGGGGARKPEEGTVRVPDEALEQLPQPPASQGADVAREVVHRRGLRLGQVVALGIVGQRDLHDVEGIDVGIVALGPRNADPHDGPGRQVDDRGVLHRRGQHEEMERRTSRGRHLLLATGGAT